MPRIAGLALCLLIAIPPLLARIRAAENPEAPDLWHASTDTWALEAGDAGVVRVLKPIWRQYRLPAIAGACFSSRGLERVGTVGVRKTGSNIPVTPEDRWHLGSETKAMTAALAARLVEKGLLRWESSVGGVFPELGDTLDPAMKRMTLADLLQHRAGVRPNLDWNKVSSHSDVREQRLESVRAALGQAPLSSAGLSSRYSNTGYVVVGAMIERVTGLTWESAIQQELFTPLGMRSAGFGGTGTPGQVDQPWGHLLSNRPADLNGPSADNPPVLGPAGRVHASIRDWTRFLADQLGGAQGRPGFLQPDSYAKLFAPPPGGDYVMGWLVTERDWGDGTVYTHAGCNTMNYTVAWLAPRRDFGVVVCINQGDQQAERAADAAAAALIGFMGGEP